MPVIGSIHKREQVEGFERALRVQYLRAPAGAVEAEHMAMIAAAAREAREAFPTADRAAAPTAAGMAPWRLRLRIATVAAAVVLGLPASFAGLAVAGVSLPEPAQAIFESVGIALPNQGESDDRDQGGDAARGPGSRDLREVSESGGTDQPRRPGVATGAGEGAPASADGRRPAGSADGPPARTPSGPPARTPSGAPDGSPSGRPHGTPGGSSGDAGAGSQKGPSTGLGLAPDAGAIGESAAGAHGSRSAQISE